MTKIEARTVIRRHAKLLQEVGCGDGPLSERDLVELESDARRLLAAVEAYRSADQSEPTLPHVGWMRVITDASGSVTETNWGIELPEGEGWAPLFTRRLPAQPTP
jgi:hypothetical protein